MQFFPTSQMIQTESWLEITGTSPKHPFPAVAGCSQGCSPLWQVKRDGHAPANKIVAPHPTDMDGRICFDQPPRPHFETPGRGGCTCFCCEVLESVQWLVLLRGTVAPCYGYIWVIAPSKQLVWCLLSVLGMGKIAILLLGSWHGNECWWFFCNHFPPLK